MGPTPSISKQSEPGSAWRTGLAAAAIAAAAGFVFAPVIRGGWLWDDPTEITQNPALRDPAGLAKIWSGAVGQDYFPLKTSVQWVEWHLWQDRPAGYHLVSIALHSLGALLLWRILRKLGVREAYLGGLLFTVHPLVVESVAWISELKNVLSLPLLLLALDRWIHWDEARGGARTAGPPVPTYLFALGFFMAAMLSKSSVVMFPAILLLYCWWKRGRIARADLWASAPFFAVSLILGWVTLRFQTGRVMAHLPMPVESWAVRTAAAGPAALFYLVKSVAPVRLLPIYPRGALPSLLGWGGLSWGGLAAGLGWCWTRRAAWGRPALFGLGFFFLNLAPVLGIIPMAYLRVARVSDHFAYLPLAGLIGLAAAAADRWRSAVRPAVFWAGAAAIIAVCAGASRGYAGIFTSEESLWTYTLKRNPEAWLAENNLAIVLARSGRLDEAIRHGEAAVRLRPEFPEARSNLGLALAQAGRLPEAIAQLEEALRLRPDLVGTRLALAVAHNNRGNALARGGRLTEAVAEFERAGQLEPDNAGVRRNLSYALHALGRDREALAELDEADRLDRNAKPIAPQP